MCEEDGCGFRRKEGGDGVRYRIVMRRSNSGMCVFCRKKGQCMGEKGRAATTIVMGKENNEGYLSKEKLEKWVMGLGLVCWSSLFLMGLE